MIEGRIEKLLLQMRETAGNATTWVDGLTKDEFLENPLTQSAVAMMIVVVGEIATTIVNDYAAFAAEHDDIRWTSMRNMRNRIAHGYYELSWGIVWDTVVIDLPPLQAWLDTVLRDQR